MKEIEWYQNNDVTETYTHLSADELKVRAKNMGMLQKIRNYICAVLQGY